MMNEFFTMGGYGGYVWPSYAISAVVLIGIVIQSFRQLKGAEKELELLRQADTNANAGDGGQGAPSETNTTPTLESKPHEA